MVAGFDHCVGVGEFQRHRFFDDDMRPVLCQFQDVARMVAAFGQHDDNVRLLRQHHLMHVGEIRDAIFLADCLGLFFDSVTNAA